MTTLNGPLGQTSALDMRSVTDSFKAPATNVNSVLLNADPGGNSQVRLTFTSAEVGNGNTSDSNTMPNQDGGFAVRAQGEDGTGSLTGAVSRFGDEGVQFIGANDAVRFDVRDLVSGVARGDMFQAVQLGTQARDFFDHRDDSIAYYVNAGMGADTIQGGRGNDFLVGGAGNDALNGNSGNDSFIGGAGDDAVTGGSGNDTAIFNVLTDGTDRMNLGTGLDRVNVAGTGVTQVRLTFTSAEVGNNAAIDSNGMANQDGDLAVRLQSEDSGGNLTGAVSRIDDEGITFVSSTPGLTFDVRDLVSGVARGDMFQAVQLGTQARDFFDHRDESIAYYVNAGMGADTIQGGRGNDFLVGGAGNDALNGNSGNDSFIGGAGDDAMLGGSGNDTAIFNVLTDGADRVNLGSGLDRVNVAGTGVTQVRLTFTSAEVGNNAGIDSNAMANQDGDLAVRLQAEDSEGNLTGAVSRVDDEGITFVSTTPGLMFDVRDLVSGVARGDGFSIVQLGSSGNETITHSTETRAVYVNAGMGNDNLIGGSANDFLVGGGGSDAFNGGMGDDTFIGGAGADSFDFRAGSGNDTILDFVSGTDRINLRALNIDLDDVNVTVVGSDTFITGDSNGNGNVDFTIRLVNTTSFADSDFVF